MGRAPRIAGFELIQPLGGGPFSRVYSAHEFASDSVVALKHLPDDAAHFDLALSLLRREARAGMRVAHPNLVRVRVDHTIVRPYYLTMDLLRGESLRAALKRRYLLRPNTALWIARQVAEALAALHRRGYVHGDVKPENVRLTDAHTAVLIDLGYAHKPGDNARFLADGYILGTANYLAPEACDRTATPDYRADVFSLGVMLYEMLTAELPYPTGTPAQTLETHRTLPPYDLRDRAGSWPRALPALVRRMMAHSPLNRPHGPALVDELTALEIAALRQSAA
jgi:serine/threonine protein kinase